MLVKMKFLIASFVVLAVGVANCAEDVCLRSDPELSGCLQNQLAAGNIINLSVLDPLEVKSTTINQRINELVWMKANVQNVRTRGFKDAIIEEFKVDPENLIVELRLNIPTTQFELEYDVSGQLLIIPMQSRGYFEGNFTDIKMYTRGFFSKINRDGVDYFNLDNLEFVSRVGDGAIKMISKNPALQFAADLIANFYNGNPRLVMDNINPIYVRYAGNFFKQWVNEQIANLPASTILQE